jgi:hypothetical protein
MAEVNPEEFKFLDIVDAPPVEEEPAKPKKSRSAAKKAPLKKVAAAVDQEPTPEPVNMADLDDSAEHKSQQPKKAASKKPARPANIEIDDDTKKAAEDKQTLIMTVMRYQESARFSDYLKKNGLITKCETLNKKSPEELKELLVRIRFCLSNRGAGSLIDEMIRAAMSGTEALVSAKTRYKITGMSEMAFSDEEWLDCYELCKLEYLSFGYIRPELRLMLSTFRIASACHVLNTDARFANINTLNKPKQEFRAEEAKLEAPAVSKLDERKDNIVSTAGVKKSNSQTLGRASNLIEPEFD